jgi:hypothetical protein
LLAGVVIHRRRRHADPHVDADHLTTAAA